MQTATMMVAQALGFKPHDGESHPCGLCGAEQPARPADRVLKSGFTNRDELTTPWVCWACEECIGDKRTRSSHLVTNDGAFRRVERKETWTLLLDPPEPPFVIYFTASGQKHGLFRQAVATSRNILRVQCESDGGMFVRLDDARWMRAAAELVLAGCARSSMETGRYDPADYARCDPEFVVEREATLRHRRPSALWRAIIGVMPGKADLPDVMPLLEEACR